MTDFDEIIRCLREIEQDRGPFAMAAIFKPEGQIRADLMLSATWLGEGSLDDLRHVADKLRPAMSTPAWRMIFRMVPIPPDADEVRAFAAVLPAKATPFPLAGPFQFGLRRVEKAIVLIRGDIAERAMPVTGDLHWLSA